MNQQSHSNQIGQQPQASNTRNYLLAVIVALTAIILAFPSLLRTISPKITQTIARQPTRTMATIAPSKLNVTKRPWSERGHADHGWLYTFHTFSFASYYNPKFQSYGPLRVINEDRVEAGTGFGTHSHAEFLIWSYIVNGELEHKDSMGNLEILKRGDVQFTSAGTGIRHSEYNRNNERDNHFLQIWAKPNVRGLKPSYTTRNFTDEMKKDKLVRIIESTDRHNGADGEHDPIPAHSDLSMDASILSPGKTVEHELVADGNRKLYAHVVMTDRTQPSEGANIKIGDVVLGEGDGAFIDGASGKGNRVQIENVGTKPAEFVFFDMGEN